MHLLPPPATLVGGCPRKAQAGCPALPCPASHGTRLPTEPGTTAPGPRPACLSTSGVSSHAHCPPTHRGAHYSLLSEEIVAYGKELLTARGQHSFQSCFPCIQALGISPSRFDCDICPSLHPCQVTFPKSRQGNTAPVLRCPLCSPSDGPCSVLLSQHCKRAWSPAEAPPGSFTACAEGWQKDWEWFKTNV